MIDQRQTLFSQRNGGEFNHWCLRINRVYNSPLALGSGKSRKL
jgi:hypothetical protein